MVEPVQGSSNTDPEPGKHSKLPSMFSAAAPAKVKPEHMARAGLGESALERKEHILSVLNKAIRKHNVEKK